MSGYEEQRMERAQFSRSAGADRLPPYSAEAEAGVLGCVLLDPKACLGECVEAFPEGGGVFYDVRHERLYGLLVEMWDANEAIDVITLLARLNARGILEEVGGIEYLNELPDRVPSAANLSYYLELVRDHFLKRSMLRALTEGAGRIYEFDGETAELLDGIEAGVLKVNEGRSQEAMRGMKPLVEATVQRMEDMHRGVGMMGGIRTHFGYFDKMTGGLHRKEMMVLAGRPSVGKTSRAMNMVANVALLEKLPVGVFSMEMSADDLTMRLMCAEAEVNFHHIRTGFIADADFPKLTRASGLIAHAPIYIDDTAALSILQLRAKARRMAHQKGIKFIVIDYLQLMHSTNKRAQSREQEIADISGGIKAMAKELDVPVLVLSQLNREGEKNKNRKPQLADLRESGAIEQDADLVEILYKPKGDDQAEDDADEFFVNGLIAKQRNGPTGDVQYLFKRFCMKYVDKFGNRGKERMPSNEELGISGIGKS